MEMLSSHPFRASQPFTDMMLVKMVFHTVTAVSSFGVYTQHNYIIILLRVTPSCSFTRPQY